MHLTPDELIELAEDAHAESLAPHLESCIACRQQLADLRAVMSAVALATVPEPSPLFWGHLAERVRDAVAEETPRRWLLGGEGWTRLRASAAFAAAAAAAVLVVYFSAPRVMAPSAGARDAAAVPSAVDVPPLQPAGLAEDPRLALVADLLSQMDPAAAADTEWIDRVGRVDQVVAALTDDERLELQRLLKEALAKPDA